MRQSLLYVGTDAPDSTSCARLHALGKYYRVSLLKLPDINKGFNRLLRKMDLDNGKIRKQVIRKVKEHKFDIIWFDKPVYVTNVFMKELENFITNTKLIAHVTDDLTLSSHHFYEFLTVGKKFDFIFTCNKENIAELPELPLFYNELGFDSHFFKYSRENTKCTDNIVFVGHYEPAYLQQLSEVADQASAYGIKVKVFGPGWWRVKYKLNRKSNIVIKSGWISREKMAQHYREAKLAVALYSSLNRNKTSGRIFELAALGTPFILKPNQIINEKNFHFINFDQIHNEKFWKAILQEYSTIKLDFIKQSSKCERYSWQTRIKECINIINGRPN